MPTYDYRCQGCGHEFEEFQSIKAAPLATCPECREDKLQRLIGPGAALLFKGSGFYLTDYRSAGYKSAAKADSGGGASAGNSGSASSASGGTGSGSGGTAAASTSGGAASGGTSGSSGK